jgi:filamentous hemagglutinin family protein
VPAAAQVVPAGTTATTAVTAASGKVTVSIAPVVRDGISHNTYLRFNVPVAGVDLNNSGIGARTIVTQVTGADPSRIQGPLAVTGPPAHVILANPNGVTVDGGSFVNTSRVVISTGVVSFVDRNPTPLTTQRNVVLTTSQGQIRIEGAGLASAMYQLELIAKSIRVDADIRSTSVAPNPEVRLTAGASRAEFDSSVSTVNTLSPWSSITANGGSSPGTVLADITALGNISAGTIRIAITDAGAGVRHAGRIAASAGDFTIAAEGKVEFLGGRVVAAQDIIVGAPPGGTTLPALVAGPGADSSAYALVAERHVDLGVGAATLTGGTISAGSAALGGDVTLGIDNVIATGPFQLTGRDTPSGYEPVSITARGGGFGLFAETQDVWLSGVTIAANQRAILVARDFLIESPLAADGSRRVSSLVAGSVEGDFAGAFTQRGALIQGATGVRLEATSLEIAAVGNGTNFAPSAVLADAADVDVIAVNRILIAGSDVIAQRHVAMEGGDFAIETSGGRASQVTAATGALVISALTGDIVSEGSTLQGATINPTNPGSLGAITLRAGGSIENRSLSADQIAVVFAQGGALDIQAGGDVVNHAGRFVANGDLRLVAAGRFDNRVDQVQLPQAGRRVEYASRGGTSFFRSKETTGYYIEYGDLVIPGQLAYVAADGAVSINAARFTNSGGEVFANRGDLRVATRRVDNVALITGRARFERTCAWFCSESGSSTLMLNGGNIAASRDMVIDATDAVTNTGGRFIALGNLTVTAPTVIATALPLYRYLERPSGLGGLFGVQQARLRMIDQGGGFIASMGRLQLDTVAPVRLEGGFLEGGAGVATPAGRDIVRRPVAEPLGDVRHIGLARWLLF